jgi:hypothetical protein
VVDVGVWGGDKLSRRFFGGMTRVLERELLDELPANDARAIHSRRDLRRINALMGNARVITRFLMRYVRRANLVGPLRVAEIGAGDGYIAMSVARALSERGVKGNLLLVDRIAHEVQAVENWNVEVIAADVFDWLNSKRKADIIIANLFLHHFEDGRLRDLLGKCAGLCDCFVAAEPRRSGFAEWFAGRVKLVGCNDVTLHDAEISVRAGFNSSELSTLWPRNEKWRLVEKRAGLFTHFFGAVRE